MFCDRALSLVRLSLRNASAITLLPVPSPCLCVALRHVPSPCLCYRFAARPFAMPLLCVWFPLRIGNATAMGFEPLRAEPNGFLVHHLNHSATLSWCMFIVCALLVLASGDMAQR